MAIADKGTLGSGVSFTSSTTCLGSTTTTADVGDIIVVYTATDNTSTTTGTNTEVSSVTDTAGNTYTKFLEYTNSPGGVAADGVTVSVWMTRVTTQLVAGTNNLTATFSGSRVMKVWGGRVFTVAAGSTLTQSATAVPTAVTAANDFGSASFSGLSSKERLYLRGMGKEANTTSALTTTTNYTSLSGGRSANDPLAITAKGEFRIVTATGETSNPTLAVVGDTSSVFVALEELVLSPTFTPDPKTLAFTGWTPLAVPFGANVPIPVPNGALRFKGPYVPSAPLPIGAANLTFTGQTPVATLGFMQPATASLVLSGKQPVALNVPRGIYPIGKATLSLTGQYVGQGFGEILLGSLTFTGYAPGKLGGYAPIPDPDPLTLTGPAPFAVVTTLMQPASASLTLTAQTPAAVTFGVFAPQAAALTFAGPIPQAFSLPTSSPTFTIPTATLVLTGQTPAGVPQDTVSPSQAQLTIATYQPVAAIVGLSQPFLVPTGTLTLAGAAPTLQYFWVISPAPARLRLLGPDPSLEGPQFGSGKTAYPAWQASVITS